MKITVMLEMKLILKNKTCILKIVTRIVKNKNDSINNENIYTYSNNL